MFVITKEKSTRARDVVGVFDLDTATVSSVTRSFLANAEKRREVEGIHSLPKSFILAETCGESKIYLSSRLANYINRNGRLISKLQGRTAICPI